MKKNIFKDVLSKGFSFPEYINHTETLLSEGKTKGPNQSQELVDYTKLNLARMKRIMNTTTISEKLKSELNLLSEKWLWLVITEAWCGDAANIIPVLAKISESSGNIDFKLILRDENPDFMNMYLTNGSKSIPILVCVNSDTFEELGKWGPRPANLQGLVMEFKKKDNFSLEELKKKIQLWYLDDKTESTQKELLEKIKEWKTK